jgi:hypothetical protein
MIRPEGPSPGERTAIPAALAFVYRPSRSLPGRKLVIVRTRTSQHTPSRADGRCRRSSDPRGVNVDDRVHQRSRSCRRPMAQRNAVLSVSSDGPALHLATPLCIGATATQRGSPPLAYSATARPLYSGATATQRGSPPTHETCRPRRSSPALISGTLRPSASSGHEGPRTSWRWSNWQDSDALPGRRPPNRCPERASRLSSRTMSGASGRFSGDSRRRPSGVRTARQRSRRRPPRQLPNATPS